MHCGIVSLKHWTLDNIMMFDESGLPPYQKTHVWPKLLLFKQSILLYMQFEKCKCKWKQFMGRCYPKHSGDTRVACRPIVKILSIDNCWIQNLANTICLRVLELQLPFTSLTAIKRYQGRSPQIGTERVSVTSAKTYFFP